MTPLADRLGLEVVQRYSAGQEAALAAELIGLAGAVLVCWQHEAIPDLASQLGAVEPATPTRWPDDRFDVVWTFVPVARGWRFAQVPQLLLSGDLPDPLR